MGVLDKTIVVVTADHGDEFFEHGRKGHKQALYDESILVPLVMRFPAKVPAGRVVEDQVRLMDIAPTIVALAGLVLPPEFGPTALHGPQAPQNLVPWMTADSAATLPALPAFSDLVGDAPVPIAAIRTPALKLIQELEEPGKEELFDLVADPGEQKNLAGTDHADATLLRQKLARWRQACYGGPRLERKVTLSDDQKERLRALGYLK
jgi:arylsulfatase A-like enzyme